MRTFNKILIGVVALLFVATQALAVTSVQDDGTYEGDYTTINFSTGMSGAASTTNPSVYDVTGGPVGTDGNWTGDGTTTTLDAAPTKFIATHSTGEFMATILDTDDITGTTNAQTIDLDTDSTIIFGDNSDTMSIVFDATDVQIETSDGGIIFDMNQADGSVDFMTNNDNDDYLQITTSSNVPTIVTQGTSNLGITPDGGTVVLTGILTVSGAQTLTGATTGTSFIIGDDTIDVVVDDQLRFYSNDEESTIEAMGYEAKDGVIQITADQGDDAGDKFQLVSDTTNSLFFTNDTAVKDTHATIMTLSSAGVLTSTGDVIAVNDSATTNAVQDVLQMTSSSTGTAAAGLGAGFTVDIEDGGGIEEQVAIDFALTDVTDSAEDADITIYQNVAGTMTQTAQMDADGATLALTAAAPYLAIKSTNATNGDALISLVADVGADAGDEWEIEHDGATNDLLFQNDTTTADTPATVMTLAETGAVTLTYYMTTKYYTNLTHPGSGAPVGSIITWGGDGSCGGAGAGTTVKVCVSDGSDWIAI